VIGDWRKLNSQELHNINSLRSTIRMIRSRVRWAGHVAVHTRFWWERLKERDNREDLDLGKRLILRWILVRLDGMVWTRFIWLRRATNEGLLQTQ
jgi:hypothetical protein